MKMQVREFAKFTGVSVRTLHYYDQIGLLPPAFADKTTGYRYYDEQSLLRMQEILFYRELDFSLKSIGKILASRDHDTKKSLEEQKILLTLKKERLERLIASIDDAMKGENVMSAFDNNKFEEYKAEVQQRWGKTEAYREYSQKTAGYSKESWSNMLQGMDSIFADFAACMNKGESADSPEAQKLAESLQRYISENFYHCTREILAGLGQMYVADERFKNNIDRHGDGTAEYASQAIACYCK